MTDQEVEYRTLHDLAVAHPDRPGTTTDEAIEWIVLASVMSGAAVPGDDSTVRVCVTPHNGTTTPVFESQALVAVNELLLELSCRDDRFAIMEPMRYNPDRGHAWFRLPLAADYDDEITTTVVETLQSLLDHTGHGMTKRRW